MQFRKRFAALGSPLLLLAIAASCVGPTVCDAGCVEGMVCWYARGQCVPAPDDAGTCPDGYTYGGCATGSCPHCRDCVAACLPEGLVP